jgi:hypothetical protein
VYYADFPPPAHQHQKLLSAPRPGIINDKENREQEMTSQFPQFRVMKPVDKGNPASGASKFLPSSGSLESSRSNASLRQVALSITLYTDSPSNLSIIRFAIRASRWLPPQVAEPDIIPQDHGVCGQSIYPFCSTRITAALDVATVMTA